MDSPMLDGLDRSVVHALQIDGRVSFSRIGAVLGVSDQTVARRYRRLRSTGTARVVGQVDPWQVGQVRWYIRIRCTPDAAARVADALARRPDTSWINLTSGGTEINCVTQARTPHERDVLLLQKLPRTPRVVEVSAHCLLYQFFGGEMEHPQVVDALSVEQIQALRPAEPNRGGGEELTLDDKDHLLLEALARDGRAGYPELAAATGWSESTAKRRLDHLRRTGALYFDVDVKPGLLGYGTEARLWMSVPPSELAAVGQALAGHPEVAFAAATTGPTNLVASVVCRDVRGLYDYLTTRLGALQAVRHLETAPVIRTVKGVGTFRP